jgi:hypothetical protein
MELVEGDDLSQRIARGAIPIDEALLIAKQIADALEAAHEQSIVHRDLKPANIKVRPDGAVKVLDFGLAKAIEAATADSSTSPTACGVATQAGIILGTAAYMSPEQAKGKSVDRRTDTWAFGCVLYEMLTGKMTFKGDTISDTLAAVIRGEPDWTVLPQNTPLQIRDLLRRCLTKDPKGRMQAIGDARIAIEETLARGVEDTEAASAPVLPAGWLRVLPWSVAVAGVCAAMLLLHCVQRRVFCRCASFSATWKTFRRGCRRWGPPSPLTERESPTRAAIASSSGSSISWMCIRFLKSKEPARRQPR